MDQSQSVTARTRHAAAATTSVNSSPPMGQLTLFSSTMPSVVHVHQHAAHVSFPGGSRHQGVSHTSPCPYMTMAYGQPGPSVAAASTSYSLTHHVQAQQQHLTNRSHIPALVGSANVPLSANTGHMFLSAQSCTGLHHNGGYLPMVATATTSPMIATRTVTQTAYYEAATAAGIDMNLLQAAAAAAGSSPPPLAVSRSSYGNNNVRLLQELEAAIQEDRNRQHHHQLHHHHHPQQQLLATRARRTALSAATAVLSYESSGRLESPPLSVEELALDASTLEQALGSNRLDSTHERLNADQSNFDSNDDEELLFHQDVEDVVEETLNTTTAKSNRTENGREALSSSSLTLPIAIGNSDPVHYSDVTIQVNRTTITSSRAAAAPLRTTRKNTRSAARVTKAQERKPHGLKRGEQQEAPQEQQDRTRRSNTASTSMASRHGGGTDASASMNSPDPTLSHRSTPPEIAHTEDKKKPAISRIKEAFPLSKSKEEEESICCICMDTCIKVELASINSCKHKFCFACIEKWADRENTCPLCKERFSKIERVYKPPSSRKRKGDVPSPAGCRNSKKVKNRSQRSDFISGNTFQGLLASMDATLPNSLAQFLFSNIPGSLVSLTRGAASGRTGGGNVGGRVFATPGGVPYVDLSFSPPHSSSDNVAHGSTWGSVARSAASAAASTSRGAAEAHRARNINGNAGQQHQMCLHHPDMFGLSSGLPQHPMGGRRSGTTLLSNNNIEVVDNSDEESDADVEEVNMFIQHVRSMANRAGATATSARSFHHGPSGAIRTHGPPPFIPGSGVSYGFVSGSLPPRSYAINDHEEDAGATADNALEILDSDDDDDVIEILMRAQS